MFVNNKNIKIRFYEKMIFIRIFEENLLKLFDEGVLFGTTHTSLGQESLAVALSETIESNDIIFSSHRCHGHYIASTGDAKSLSTGISEALITTEFGLIVAIPSLIFHALLSRKAKGVISSMERTSIGFINGMPSRK